MIFSVSIVFIVTFLNFCLPYVQTRCLNMRDFVFYHFLFSPFLFISLSVAHNPLLFILLFDQIMHLTTFYFSANAMFAFIIYYFCTSFLIYTFVSDKCSNAMFAFMGILMFLFFNLVYMNVQTRCLHSWLF